MRHRRSDLGELYALHAPDARRLAYLITGDHAEAEDVVHEAFVRVAGRLSGLRSPEAFPAYLRRAVVNQATSRARSRRRERARVERHTRLRGPDVVAEPQLPDGELWQSLLRLPDRQRAAIVLRYWLDLSESRVAELLGCRPGTVKSLLSRGLHAMRGMVSDE